MRGSAIDFSNLWEYTFGVVDRLNRRQFGKVAAGGAAALIGSFIDDRTGGWVKASAVDLLVPRESKNPEGMGEHEYELFINEQARRCASICGDQKLPFPLAFDTRTKPYSLVIPGVATAGFPGITDGLQNQIIPMIADGEPLPPPPSASPKLIEPSRPNWNESLYTPIFKGPSNKPLVALTIDDGYFAREDILQTLVNKGVHATFLIIGDIMESDPAFIQRAEGTGLVSWGDHTKTHTLNFATASKAQIVSEMLSAEVTAKKLLGKTLKSIGRPPGGTRSANGINAFAENGFGTMIWNVSGDAGTQWTSENPPALAKWYLDQLRTMIRSGINPWGSILLTHFRFSTGIYTVNGKRANGPSALDLMIDGIREMGMEPTSVDRLFATN